MADSRILFGFHAVLSRMRQHPTSIEEILIDRDRIDARMKDMLNLAENANVRTMQVDRARLDGLAGMNGRHQGVIARVIDTPIPYKDIHDILESDLKEAPFFLSLHYTAPHWPWETRDDEAVAAGVADNIFHLQGGNIQTYHRMIHHMDEGIGWVMQALEKNGMRDNTLVVFTSDNGGERFSDNWPLVGGKMDLTEGGIRVPWIAHWPALIAPGTTSEQHCMTMDWSATMLDAAGVKGHADYPLDGISLLPVLRDANHRFSRPLHWRMNHRSQRALRDGDWKYLKVDEHEYLFNIPADERERANRGRLEPERLAAMRQAWLDWNGSMPPIPADATVSLGFSVKDMPQR